MNFPRHVKGNFFLFDVFNEKGKKNKEKTGQRPLYGG
jgi:hypothetical protein